MLKTICHLFLSAVLLLCAVPSFSQSDHKFAIYLSGQYTQTLYDITEGNNPWAPGISMQGFFNNRHIIKPMIDLSVDVYLEDDKVARYAIDEATCEEKNINDVGSPVNLFAGIAVQPLKPLYISFTGGPSLINGHTYFGIKPSVGVYFDKHQNITARLSYINVYNRDKESHSDFGSVAIGVGIRLF